MKHRLNKVIAASGLASRRAADRFIEEGRVTVNGARVTVLGSLVDPERDAIKVDGRRLRPAPPGHTYLMLHKPRGLVTTMADPEGRPTVRDLLRGVGRRVYPVGRLDQESEGLLLFTDDGQLARALMHPSSGVAKTYEVKVRGVPAPDALERLRCGIPLDRRPVAAERVSLLRSARHAWCEVRIHEGRKHVVRRMFAAVGHPVLKLRRTAYDGLRLGDLAPGRIRPLTPAEVARLRRAAGLPARPRRSS